MPAVTPAGKIHPALSTAKSGLIPALSRNGKAPSVGSSPVA